MAAIVGEYHCPVLNKVFTEFTHIVAVRTTGNVFCYEVCVFLLALFRVILLAYFGFNDSYCCYIHLGNQRVKYQNQELEGAFNRRTIHKSRPYNYSGNWLLSLCLKYFAME